MPKLALAAVVAWFFVLFVFRSLVQWWRTGSSGVKGFSGRIGSREWLAGTTVSLGLVLAGLAPIAALASWPGGALVFEVPFLHVAGAVLSVVGLVGALAAQLEMGDSWRIGVDAGERTELVTHGLYRWVRNPIFSFMLLSGLGLALVVPNLPAAAAVLLVALGIELQVRSVEEPYLSHTHGEVYRAYGARTGRFVPGLGRFPARA